MTHMCPQCGKELIDEYQQVCECGFDFNDTITCPYKMSNKCVHTDKKCKIKGLDFESCETYLTKSGISYPN